jgi:hypothetical protein
MSNRKADDSPGDAWLILFDDADVGPELFTGEGAERAAKLRYEALAQSWSVYLFRSVAHSTPA